jgi:hypothetical protein
MDNISYRISEINKLQNELQEPHISRVRANIVRAHIANAFDELFSHVIGRQLIIMDDGEAAKLHDLLSGSGHEIEPDWYAALNTHMQTYRWRRCDRPGYAGRWRVVRAHDLGHLLKLTAQPSIATDNVQRLNAYGEWVDA